MLKFRLLHCFFAKKGLFFNKNYRKTVMRTIFNYLSLQNKDV
jgi:hypothetical protein